MGAQLIEKRGLVSIFQQKIVTQPALDKEMFHSGQIEDAPVELRALSITQRKIPALLGHQALFLLTRPLPGPAAAFRHEQVRGRSAHIRDRPLEIVPFREQSRLP